MMYQFHETIYIEPCATQQKKRFSKNTILLFIILAFAFITRVARLEFPEDYYFDEIYHAFTARQIVHNDPKVWEWWNGMVDNKYAYEWSHPSFAKLAMAFSMLLFGENSFAWRLPGVLLSVLSILLVYLIAQVLFNSSTIGLIAAAICALDGLGFTMSRIGKDDIYVPFFVLLTFYLFIKDYYFFSSASLGLAIASKWSGIFVVPILIVAHFILQKKITWNYLWYLFIPFLVYAANYIPLLLTGHPWQNFFEMQKQMFQFHTGLKDSHPYASPAWSWPLNLRPIFLYYGTAATGYASRVYAMGNPFIFWTGLLSIIYGFFYMLIQRDAKVGLLVFSYFMFIIPCLRSPRFTMIYLYIPSMYFMSITLAYFVEKYSFLLKPFLFLCVLFFVYFYPHWTGIEVPEWFNNSY